MDRKSINIDTEKKLVINMIMDDLFIKDISKMIDISFLDSDYAKLIVKWCLEYYENYKEAPKTNIEDIFRLKAERLSDEDRDAVQKFLQRELKEYKKISNYEFFLKEVEKWLKLHSLSYLRDRLDEYIFAGNPEKGEHLIATYKRVERFHTEETNILKDPIAIYEALTEEKDRLFKFPKALGEGLGWFTRGDLVSFLGFMNKGKTWWLIYSSIIAIVSGLKVIFFSLEMTRNQVIKRMWRSLTGEPEYDTTVFIPKFEKINKGYRIIGEEREFKATSKSLEDIKKKQRKLKTRFRGGLKVHIFPAYGASVEDIIDVIDNMEYYNNFVPDVVVIDYADIIKPMTHMEYRHQLDLIWKKLRGLAQDRNILVITATQSTRKGAVRDVGEGDIAEDIRKLAHVSKMISINQSENEYKKSAVRVKLIKEREGRKGMEDIMVLQALDIGKVHLDSKFRKEVVDENENE